MRLIRIKIDYRVTLTRFLLETCLEMGLAAIICIEMIEEENCDHFWEAFSTTSAFFCLVCLVFAPFYQIRLRNQYLENLARLPVV